MINRIINRMILLNQIKIKINVWENLMYQGFMKNALNFA